MGKISGTLFEITAHKGPVLGCFSDLYHLPFTYQSFPFLLVLPSYTPRLSIPALLVALQVLKLIFFLCLASGWHWNSPLLVCTHSTCPRIPWLTPTYSSNQAYGSLPQE